METQAPVEERQETIQAEISELLGNNHVALLVQAEIVGDEVWIVGHGLGENSQEIGRISEEDFYAKKAEENGDLAVLKALGYKIGEQL